MSDVRVKMPWGVWCRVHARAIATALPLSCLLAVEGRDMYYRSTWSVTPLAPSCFHSGDVIVLCNRWYALNSWSHVWYSFVCKILYKSCWDDVAIVSRTVNGMPHVFYCDFDGAHECPLDNFLQHRLPRGAAVRTLHVEQGVEDGRQTAASSLHNSDTVADLFWQQVHTIPSEPWKALSAARRDARECHYFEHCVRMHEQRVKIKRMIDRRQSHDAIVQQQSQLREMEKLREYLEQRDMAPHPAYLGIPFHLFNGSLVASYLTTFGLLPRNLPSPARYVPPDFSHNIPLLGTYALDEPIVFFRT